MSIYDAELDLDIVSHLLHTLEFVSSRSSNYNMSLIRFCLFILTLEETQTTLS